MLAADNRGPLIFDGPPKVAHVSYRLPVERGPSSGPSGPRFREWPKDAPSEAIESNKENRITGHVGHLGHQSVR
jgi:hypothetical protein